MRKISIYSGEAVDTSGPSFGFAILKTNTIGDLIVDIALKNAKPNTTYYIWINQHPGARPQPKLTAPGVLTTNTKGKGSTSVRVARITGATDLWISVTNSSEYLRSAAVVLN